MTTINRNKCKRNVLHVVLSCNKSRANQTNLKHPRASLRSIIQELGANFCTGSLDFVRVVHVGDALRVFDHRLRVLGLGPDAVERDLCATVETRALWRLGGVVGVDRNLLATEEHCKATLRIDVKRRANAQQN